MKNILFWKYQGSGNDFIIIDDINNVDEFELSRIICDRNFGFGGDGLIIYKNNPLTMRIINRDGSEATMCGNGIRCFIRFCVEQKKLIPLVYQVQTKAGNIEGKVINHENFAIQINMGEPSFDQSLTGVLSPSYVQMYSFYMHFHIYIITTLFIGTIHTVLFVSNVDEKRWDKVGYELHKHPFFSKQTNVNFVEVVDNHTIKVRTYEKGVGFTLACGTGACASAYCAFQQGFCLEKIDVLLARDVLTIEIIDNHVLMSGSAQYIGKGIYHYKEDE